MTRARWRLYFVTDLHGSSLCFRKFINAARSRMEPDVLVVGADITGKHLVPVFRRGAARWCVQFEGRKTVLEGRSALQECLIRLEDMGAYGFVCSTEEWLHLESSEDDLAAKTEELQLERLRAWTELAEERITGSGKLVFVNGGNDDPFSVDEVLDTCRAIERPEGRVCELPGGIELISTGYSNLTPWQCPRDVTEENLRSRIDKMVAEVKDLRKCIFNFHCPPRGSGLDRAKALDCNLRPRIGPLGPEEADVGSTAVRAAIEEWQPVVSLHGHIHEQHGYVKLGRTVAFNPGSEYQEGRLQGVLLEFEGSRLRHYTLTREQIPPRFPQLVGG